LSTVATIFVEEFTAGSVARHSRRPHTVAAVRIAERTAGSTEKKTKRKKYYM